MIARLSALLALSLCVVAPTAFVADQGQCGTGLQAGTCGSVAADQQAGEFHGLIAVRGNPDVLSTAAHSGTQAGCGDCVWELIPACPKALPGDPNGQDASCAGPSTAKCAPGQLAFRLYLSTAAVRNELVSVLCLGGVNDVIPVGDIAAGDVQRYLKDVTPPDLTLKVQPDNGVPAGLPAYFWVRPPAMTPAPFGNGQVTETITIKPMRYRWTWGDGDATGWTTDAGAPYPDGTLTHTYLRSAHYRGDVVAEWGGTYTITVAGQTYGPYDAIGTVTKQQPFAVTVLKAHSTLVSHG